MGHIAINCLDKKEGPKKKFYNNKRHHAHAAEEEDSQRRSWRVCVIDNNT